MSRILKASYINLENNIIIDNTFSPSGKTEPTQVIESEPYNPYNEELEAEIEQIKQNTIEQANEEAAIIIEEARQQAHIEAENIKNEAQQQMDIKAEEIYKEAFDKGYQEGNEKAEADCELMKEEAQSIIEEAKQERQNMIDSLEAEIVNFIIDTTQNILTSSFQFNPTIISFLIKKGLGAIKEIKNLKIFVSENNYDFVEENKYNILQVDTERNNVEIVKDVTLKDTDCIIETDIGTIQCNLDDQLSSIKEALHYILN